MDNEKQKELLKLSTESGCGCKKDQSEGLINETNKTTAMKKVLNVELLVIDLETCKRCVPTGNQLKTAVQLLKPVAHALGIELRHHEIVVKSQEKAKNVALLSSPTVRLNGRDIVQDIHESECESCGSLTTNNINVECREWYYQGQAFSYAPLPMLIEAIMSAMLNIDEMPQIVSAPLENLPENLKRYFENKREKRDQENKCGSSCCR